MSDDRGGHHTGSARKRFVFHAALIGSNANLVSLLKLDEIHIRSARLKHRMISNFPAPLPDHHLVRILNKHDGMWNAGVDRMNFHRARLQINRLRHEQVLRRSEVDSYFIPLELCLNEPRWRHESEFRLLPAQSLDKAGETPGPVTAHLNP